MLLILTWGEVNVSLYRIMIVDDEEEIRLGIIKKIDWEGNGFIVVADCENGRDALEMAEKLRPDIIMTDVKMPFMDGLELGNRISEIMPSTKIIIFSGSDDFEYAKKAIKINAVEYVLKPVNSMELIDVLKKLKNMLDKEHDEKRNLEMLNKHYIDSIPIIREQMLVSIIEGRTSKGQWKCEAEKIGLNLISNYFSVAVFNLDKSTLSNSQEGEALENQEMLMAISLKKIIDETMGVNCKRISFYYYNTVVVIGGFDDHNEVYSFIQEINEVCRVFMRIMDIKISAGIGHVYNNINEIRYSYRGAQSALDYRFILGLGKAIYIDDVEPDKSITLQLDEQEERRFVNAIKISKEDEISEIVNNLFEKVEYSLVPINQYRIYCMEIITALLKMVQAYNLNMQEIFEENFNCYRYLESLNSIYEVKKWFEAKALMINSLIKKERVNSSKVLIEKAKEYIQKNFSDSDMSVEKLCSELHVSPTYFSTIFKRETEMSFVNYLTTVRLEEAIKLLNTTDDKTYIIAKKVGYLEANYFSYVFKKKFGVSPIKYRRN